MVIRCSDRLKSEIPIEQAVHQPVRSTTESLYTVKPPAEKAIFSSDYTIFVLMLDMSETLDSINRAKLIDYLMNILINDETGNDIITNVGACQGDCLSAVFFILYLAKLLKPLAKYIEKQHDGAIM